MNEKRSSTQEKENRTGEIRRKNLRFTARRTACLGLMSALALSLTLLEGFFTPVLPPGVRLGLSNIVVMFTLSSLGFRAALAVVLFKALFVLLTRGVSAFWLSLLGGLVSFFVIAILSRSGRASLLRISVCGALSHNFAQTAGACFLTGSLATLWYFPVLLLTGIGAGVCTGMVLKAVLPILGKLAAPSIGSRSISRRTGIFHPPHSPPEPVQGQKAGRDSKPCP